MRWPSLPFPCVECFRYPHFRVMFPPSFRFFVIRSGKGWRWVTRKVCRLTYFNEGREGLCYSSRNNDGPLRDLRNHPFGQCTRGGTDGYRTYRGSSIDQLESLRGLVGRELVESPSVSVVRKIFYGTYYSGYHRTHEFQPHPPPHVTHSTYKGSLVYSNKGLDEININSNTLNYLTRVTSLFSTF